MDSGQSQTFIYIHYLPLFAQPLKSKSSLQLIPIDAEVGGVDQMHRKTNCFGTRPTSLLAVWSGGMWILLSSWLQVILSDRNIRDNANPRITPTKPQSLHATQPYNDRSRMACLVDVCRALPCRTIQIYICCCLYRVV